MKGSKVSVPVPVLVIVLPAAFVPHQLLVAVTVAPAADCQSRLLPVCAVLPAKRLKLMVRLSPVPVETSMPPPNPVLALAAFPVIATLEIDPVRGVEALNQ